jgi:hypothetical protein
MVGRLAATSVGERTAPNAPGVSVVGLAAVIGVSAELKSAAASESTVFTTPALKPAGAGAAAPSPAPLLMTAFGGELMDEFTVDCGRAISAGLT